MSVSYELHSVDIISFCCCSPSVTEFNSVAVYSLGGNILVVRLLYSTRSYWHVTKEE